MGKDSELFKAAQSGNNAVLERAFASFLKKNSTAGSGGGGGGGHSFGRCVYCCVGVCCVGVYCVRGERKREHLFAQHSIRYTIHRFQ